MNGCYIVEAAVRRSELFCTDQLQKWKSSKKGTGKGEAEVTQCCHDGFAKNRIKETEIK